MANQKKNSAFESNDVLSKSEAFVVKQKNTIIWVVVAIVVIIAGALLYHTFVSVPNNEKASTMMAKGQEYFAQGDFQKAANGDGAGFMGFINLSKQYSGTDAGNLSKLYAGISLAHLGKAQDALEYLKDYDQAGDEMIEPETIGAMGDCYATLGNVDKAVECFKKAAEKADNNSLSPVFLIKAGEMLESQNKFDDALKMYQEVKDKYLQSPMQNEIDKYIERVNVKEGK